MGGDEAIGLAWHSGIEAERARRQSRSPPIAMHAIPFLPGLSPVGAKSLTARFDAGRLSSDGGLIVLREIAVRLRLAETITGLLRDDRDPARVRHGYAE